jgi:hypothetical protein
MLAKYLTNGKRTFDYNSNLSADDMKSLYSKFFFIFLAITAITLIEQKELDAQPVLNYMPAKIGWHDAVYDDNQKEPKLVPWTTWDNAIEREMNWYLKAPLNEHGYPSYVYITFMDGNYKSYRRYP